MTLKEWLSKSITRPHKIVAVFLLAVWSVFAIRSYMTVESKQHTYVKQTADLLSIAVHQQNRVIAESLLETLLSQGGATSAEVCNGDKQEISATISRSLSFISHDATGRQPSFAASALRRRRSIAGRQATNLASQLVEARRRSRKSSQRTRAAQGARRGRVSDRSMLNSQISNLKSDDPLHATHRHHSSANCRNDHRLVA